MNSHQPVEHRIRELLYLRVVRLLKHDELMLPGFSIGEALNFLFTLEGDTTTSEVLESPIPPSKP